MLKRQTGSGFVDVASVKRWDGAAFVTCTSVKKWTGTVWEEVWPLGGGGGLAVVVSPGEAVFGDFCAYEGGTNTCPLFINGVTNSVTATPANGSGAGPTYLWEYVEGDSGITVSSTTAATVTFSATVPRNGQRYATWKCTVTQGVETAVGFVTVFVQYTYTREGILL